MSLKTKIPFYNKLILPYHFLKAGAGAVRYRFPARGMRVIGVTGTNGKTTTSFMIASMLAEAGYRVGIFTSVAWGEWGHLEKQMEHMTTVDPMLLNKRMSILREKGMDFLVLEATSHALAQFRTFGVPIEIAVMTNVTHEHLEYHGTFEKYMLAKRKLFKRAEYGVVNADDDNAKSFEGDVSECITYGVKRGRLRASGVKSGADGVEYVVEDTKAGKEKTKEGALSTMKIRTKIPGEFNVYNSLAAVGVGLKVGLSEEVIGKGIFALEEVEGRMNRVDEGQDFEVIVDFAHSPDSFERLLSGMRETLKGTKRKLIVLFGSAGRRDEGKRPIQGKIAGKYGDIVILTEEDDRDVSGEEILEHIAVGARQSGKRDDKDLFKVPDRRKAIEFAYSQAKSGDVVMLLGKGHETTIERNDETIQWNEANEARKALKNRKQA